MCLERNHPGINVFAMYANDDKSVWKEKGRVREEKREKERQREKKREKERKREKRIIFNLHSILQKKNQIYWQK